MIGLRWPLILASLAWALVLAYFWINDPIPFTEPMTILWIGSTLVALLLNAVYIYLVGPNYKPGRLFRMIGLWLDVKEAELRNRLGKRERENAQ